jgi:hypothetical protein
MQYVNFARVGHEIQNLEIYELSTWSDKQLMM